MVDYFLIFTTFYYVTSIGTKCRTNCSYLQQDQKLITRNVGTFVILVLTFVKEKVIYKVLLCLFHQATFPELSKFMACIFSETVISKCPSRATVCNCGSMEGFFVETMIRDATCQILYQIFNMHFHSAYLNFF